MKKIIFKIISFLYKIAAPVLSVIIGLKLVNTFNIFQVFNLVQDAEKAADICMTAYFPAVDIILQQALEYIKQTLFSPQKIQATFSKPGDLIQNTSDPDLLLRTDNLCEVRLTIAIHAKKKVCKGLKIIVESINFATMQLPRARAGINIDSQGNIIIDLESMFGNQEIANTTQTFKILFSREPVDGCRSDVRPKLNKEPVWITFNTNKLIVRTEEELGNHEVER